MYVFVLPAVGISIALLFFDLRIRKEGVQTSPETARAEASSHADLPGEIGPSAAPQRA